MRKLIKEIKSHKKGISAGALTGLIIVLYMKFTGAITTMATVTPGLLDRAIELAPLDMALFKLLLTAVLLGGFIGYVIQDRLIKK